MKKIEFVNSIIGLSLILLATILLYWPLAGYGWITGLDQDLLVDNPLVAQLSDLNIIELFLNSTAGRYIPLAILTYGIDISVMPGDPVRMIHIMNLFLHLLNIIFLFRLVQMISNRSALAVTAALIFALHPLNLDAVAWISSRGLLLASALMLSGMLVYEYRCRNDKLPWKFSYTLLYIAALLSHPVGVFFPLALILLDNISGRKEARLTSKLPLLIIAFVYVLLSVFSGGLEGFDHAFMRAFSEQFLLLKFLIPLGITGSQAGVAYAISEAAYLPVMALSVITAWCILYLISHSSNKVQRIGIVVISLVWFAFTIYVSYLRLPDWENSQKYWSRIIEIYPRSSIAYYHRGDYWAMNNDLNRAKFDYTRSISLDPLAYRPINNLGLIYLGENDLQFAIAEFKKAISIKPDFYKPHLNLGLAYMRKGNNLLALESMNMAIELFPDDAVAYYNRGLIYERENMLDEAIENFDQAIRLDPDRYIFYKDRGKALVWKQRFAEAERDFSMALMLDNSDPEMWFRRSLARVSQDKFRAGLEDALMARKLGMEVSEDYIKGLTRQILEADSVFME